MTLITRERKKNLFQVGLYSVQSVFFFAFLLFIYLLGKELRTIKARVIEYTFKINISTASIKKPSGLYRLLAVT